MAMRSLPSIVEDANDPTEGRTLRMLITELRSTPAHVVAEQQRRHGSRVKARAAINGQPFNS